VKLARLLHEKGDDTEAQSVLAGAGGFEADGLAAHIELERDGRPGLAEALSLLDRGQAEAGIEALLARLETDAGDSAEQIRRVVVGVLAELGQDSPAARDYRRRLAAALY
jgi:hypothetical protein